MIEDVDGNRFLDFNAGIAVTSTGHCHPAVVDAISQPGRRAASTTARATSTRPVYAELCRAARRARARSPARRKVFLTNSGTEAVEASIKLARHSTGRQYVIAFLGAFHGRSLGSLVAHREQGEVPPGLRPAAAGRVPRAVRRSTATSSDVLFKHLARPERRRGDRRRADPGRRRLRRAARRVGSASCATCAPRTASCSSPTRSRAASGRTGRMWAVEHEGIEPDVLLAGKGLASGLPLGAVDRAGRAHAIVGTGQARLDVRRQPGRVRGRAGDARPRRRVARAPTRRRVGDHLHARTRRPPAPLPADPRRARPRPDDRRRVRVEHDIAHDVEQAAFRRGLLVLTCGAASLRLAPPLVVTEAQAELALDLLEAAVGEVARFDGVRHAS